MQNTCKLESRNRQGYDAALSRLSSLLEMPEAERTMKELTDGVKASASSMRARLDQQREIEALEVKGEYYYLKAMNCPHHHRIFAAQPRSYRDLPLRLARIRFVLSLRAIRRAVWTDARPVAQHDDAHIYCTAEQFAAEFNAVNEMYLKYFKIFGLTNISCASARTIPRGSRRQREICQRPELWKANGGHGPRHVEKTRASTMSRIPMKRPFTAPKLTCRSGGVIGREFTLATNQVDFAVPKRFGLVYRDRDNTEKTPLCIHRAPLGTHERFIGFLIEHYAGNFRSGWRPGRSASSPSATTKNSSLTANRLSPNFVRTWCAPTRISGPTKSTAKSCGPRNPKFTPCSSSARAILESNQVSIRLHGKGPPRSQTQGRSDRPYPFRDPGAKGVRLSLLFNYSLRIRRMKRRFDH